MLELLRALTGGAIGRGAAQSSRQPEPAPDDPDRAIAHLERIHQDIRDEIKRRIEQRDNYSIQMTLAVGAIVAVSAGFPAALIAAPLVVTFFTVLVLYSYQIHRLLSGYLADKIEPELARLCGTDPEAEWERYYKHVAVPGIRRSFYLASLWFFNIACPAFLFTQAVNPLLVGSVGVVYVVAAVLVTWKFWGHGERLPAKPKA
jgi:hypothetical protein